jgi:SHS2 domain-containing protein
MSKSKIKPLFKKGIKVSGTDLENLLYNLLEELLFLLDSENFFLSKIQVKIKKGKKLELKAELEGDASKSYEINLDVKAVTYNEMFVKKIKEKWVCQVILDV